MIKRKQKYKTGSYYKKYLLLIIAHCSLLIVNCFSQSITWQRTYDGPLHEDDIGYDICNADGENFYIVGYANNSPNVLYTIKINKYGDTIWTRTVSDPNGRSIRGLAIVSSGDGGCVLTGSWDSAFTIKYDFTGNPVWLKFYGGQNIKGFDIVRSSDGGFLVCGEDLNSTYEGYFLKINANGDLMWQRTLVSMNYRSYKTVIEEITGGFVLAGQFKETPNSPAKALLTRIDIIGNISVEDTFQLNGLSTRITNIDRSSNSYFISGETIANGQFFRVFSAKMNFLFDILDTNIFFSTRNEYEPRISRIGMNRFIYTSVKDTVSPSPSFAFIRTIDSIGSVINERAFHWTNGLTINSILGLPNGDVAFAGWSMDFAPIRANIYVLRTDSLLNAKPVIGIQCQNLHLPEMFKLHQNYPNPFNPVTMIKYDIPTDNLVKIKVYDLLGREVFSSNEYKTAGSYEIRFDGTNLASGLYFYELVVGDNTNNGGGKFRDVKKMVLIK